MPFGHWGSITKMKFLFWDLKSLGLLPISWSLVLQTMMVFVKLDFSSNPKVIHST